MDSTLLARYNSRLRRAVKRLLAMAVNVPPSSLAESVLPKLSTTETWLCCNPGTELATRKRMELTAC